MLTGPLADVLRSGRAELNAQFAHARRQYPELEADAFASFLLGTVDPWVRATQQVVPERTAAVALAGYELGLELVGQRVAGPGSRHPQLEQGLRRVLPGAAALSASDPWRALSAMANALHELATTPGARPAEWVELLERAAARAENLEALLAAGQVAAWRAGLAHYRTSALAVAARLPDALALEALGAGGSSWAEIGARLERDRWFVPGVASNGPRVIGVRGAFRGFGGLFAEPPLLVRSGAEILVQSGAEAWLLMADAFGATFHRATADEAREAREQSTFPSELRLPDGFLLWKGVRIPIPTLGAITSVVCDETTLALTSAASHGVVLIALGGAG